MIPILFDADEREFVSNGLGRLSDCIACAVTEERNGQYELEMQYPDTGAHFGDIAPGRILLAMPSEGAQDQPFDIYSISEPLEGVVTVRAQHISYRLKKMVVLPFTAHLAAEAMQQISTHIAGENPFTFWTDKETSATMEQRVPIACRSLLGGVEGSVLDVFGGGEYEFDRFEVKLHAHRGADNGATIRYGVNLTGSETETGSDGVYTSIVPYWRGNGEDGAEEIVIGDRVDSDHVADFAHEKCVAMDFSADYQQAPTKAQLEERARAYMRNNETWRESVRAEVSFQQLWQTEEFAGLANRERVDLCDTVTVYGKRGEAIRAKVVKTVFNVLLERYDSIELGEPRASFSETATQGLATERDVQRGVSGAVAEASARLSEAMRTASGLYCTEQRQPDGSTVYLLHDKPELADSLSVIKLTAEAIAFSTDGGHSYPYGFRVTGEMVAKLLSANGIDANWINAGILQSAPDAEGKRAFYLDLVNGILRMEAQELEVGGKTVGDIAKAAVDGQSQADIFNKLTNNGELQGLYMKDGQLYINASYLAAGVLASRDGESFRLNLDAGSIEAKKLSWKSKYSSLSEDGVFRSVNAIADDNWMEIRNGELFGGEGSDQWTEIDLSARVDNWSGMTIACNGMICLQSPKLYVSNQYQTGSVSEAFTGTQRVVTSISGSRYEYTDLHFINGICIGAWV